MMSLNNIFFILIGMFTNCAFCQIDAEIKMFNDVAITFQTRSHFILLGFSKNENIEIIMGLSKYGFTSSIYKNNLSLMDFLPNTDSHQYVVFLLNLNSKSSRFFLQNANENKLFKFPLKWILLNKNLSNEITTDYNLKNLDFLIDSNIILIKKLLSGYYSIFKLYKRHVKDDDLIVENFGKWSEENGLENLEEENISAVRRKNLMGTVLRTAIVITHNDSLNHLTDYRDKHIDSITKVNYLLVNHLSNIVNGSLNYTIKNTWGYYMKNISKWTGMLGELTENRADIGGTPLFVTTDRVEIIDYIAMTTATKSYFVFRQPKLSYVTNVFVLPFHWTVWLSTIALVIVTTVGLFIALKWETKDCFVGGFEAKDAIIMSFGAMCQQGASSLPDKASGRIITLFIFVSLMFLYTSYSANIVALLQSSSKSIQTLEDLLRSRLTVGVDDTVFNRFYFPAATEPIRKALYLEKVAPKNQEPRFYPIEKGVKLLRKGLFAFHMEGGSGYKIVGETFYEDEKCDLQEISFLQVPDPWLAIQKNSSYKELLKIGLRQIQESGLQAREVSRIYTKKPQCHGTASSFISVGLIDIYAAIVVFGAGIGMALTVFFFELFLSQKCKKHYK